MDIEKDFHMNGGVGRTSYAQNSSLQKKASEMVKHITLEALRDLLLSDQVPIFTSIGIADLGCSSGPNTLATVKQILEAVEATLVLIHGKKIEELRVYLNDLPTNDFNSIFKSLPDFFRNLKKERGIDDEDHNKCCPSIFIGAYPGSFYARLFPASSLHFIHSSHSLHWLSKVPSGIYDDQGRSKNKGKVYISESSPPCVFQAYLKQFQEDFFLFLRLRSQELVNGGKMVLIFLGRESQDPVHDRGNSFLWELLSRSLANLVSKGEIEEEKLDSYETNFYAPSKIEIEEQVKAEGSFRIERLEVFERDMTAAVGGGRSYGKVVAMAIRAIQESVLRSHFGQGIDLDSLFNHYCKLVDDEMCKQEIRTIISILVLAKSCVNE